MKLQLYLILFDLVWVCSIFWHASKAVTGWIDGLDSLLVGPKEEQRTKNNIYISYACVHVCMYFSLTFLVTFISSRIICPNCIFSFCFYSDILVRLYQTPYCHVLLYYVLCNSKSVYSSPTHISIYTKNRKTEVDFYRCSLM